MGSKQQPRRYALAALVVLALVAVAAGCGGGSDESSSTTPASGTPTQTITIDESEYKLDPATVNLDKAGTYEFEVVNNGTIDHALEIEGGDLEEETDTIAPGQSATLTVTLADDTTYELYCPIGSHADQGMKGSIVVGAGSSTSGGDEDDESSSGY